MGYEVPVNTVNRMVERLLLCALLIAAAPLAFASGVADSTKGFLQGFVRLFTGNLVIQLLQMVIISAVFIYTKEQALTGATLQILALVILISLFKLMARLEEIVRDMSISVGIGGNAGPGILGQASTIVYTTQSVMNVVKSVGSVAG